MVKKEDRRVERTKDILRQTLIELVAEKGYSQVSVKNIVDVANYNRTTFYVHYDGKEELAKEIIALKMERFNYEFCRPTREVDILDLTKVEPEATRVYQYILDEEMYYNLIVQEDTLPHIKEEFLRCLLDIYTNKMIYYTETPSEINDLYFMEYRAYGIFGFILQWIEKKYEASPREMARRTTQLLHVQSQYLIEAKKED